MGTFAIEDFDVAMKSKLPVKYFRIYLNDNFEHYKNVLVSMLREEAQNQSHIKDTKEAMKLGEIYFNLFQIIAIYNVMAFRKKNDKFRHAMVKTQKDMIVEIIRMLDKHLEVCFPQMSRENFLESFNSVIIVSPDYLMNEDLNTPTMKSLRVDSHDGKKPLYETLNVKDKF